MHAPSCDLCGLRPVAYVCQVCGRQVCPICFVVEDEACVKCGSGVESEARVSPGKQLPVPWAGLGSALLLMGFGLVLIGVLALTLASFVPGGGASGGVVIFIGPFPIALGYGSEALPLVAVALLISAVIMLALLLRYGAPRVKRIRVETR